MRSVYFYSVQIFLLTFLLFLTATLPVQAQSEGVSITPALIEETVDAGSLYEYSVGIKNLNTIEQTFYLSSRDIAGVQGNGTPIFADESLEKTGYELSEWITLEADQIVLGPNQSGTIRFTMFVPENAEPGSHFGGIFISVDPPEIERSGAAVGYQVANILSMRVSGDVLEQATIRQFASERFLYGSQNIKFTARIENNGNVLVRPTGPLEIYNMLGEKVDTIIFNESQAGVFPGVVRELQMDWEGTGVGFGRYEAVLSLVYGDDGAKKTMSSTASFWVLPMNIIGPAAAVLALLLLVTYVSVRVYIKRTLAMYNYGGTRIVKSRRRRKSTPTLLLLTIVMIIVTSVFLIILLALFA